jgi:quercetin dioxygenase-like cupin family protein
LEAWDIRSLDVKPHSPQILRTDAEARVIAIQLPAGEELKEHQTHERAYLLVADGEIEVDEGGRSQSGGPGFLAQFDPQERRTVRATSDARLVLILGPWPGEGHQTSQR